MRTVIWKEVMTKVGGEVVLRRNTAAEMAVNWGFDGR